MRNPGGAAARGERPPERPRSAAHSTSGSPRVGATMAPTTFGHARGGGVCILSGVLAEWADERRFAPYRRIRHRVKKDSSIGVVGRGGALFWARATRAQGSAPAGGGAGPPPAGAEGVTLVLPLRDAFCKAMRIPSADPDEIAVIARNMMEAESPLDPADMVFSHETLEVSPPGADGEGGSALVMAASAPVSAVEALREGAGCDAGRVERVDAAPFALAAFAAATPGVPADGRVPALFDDDGRVSLLVVDKGRPVVARDAGAASSASAPQLALALRLALVQAEREAGPAQSAPLAVFAPEGSRLPGVAAAAAAALGLEAAATVPAPDPGRTAFEAARRSVDGAACNLFPESWGGMLSDRKFKRRFAAGAAGALAAWLALVGVLFGWPAALSVREASLQKEADRLSPEEAVVDQFRSRIRIIDRYSDRTWSPLEVLREVAVALPQGVTLTMFRQEAAKREALVEAAARSSAPAYEFSNRLKSSPLFSRNDIVAGPTENRNTGRTSFQLRLLFAEPGEGGGAP